MSEPADESLPETPLRRLRQARKLTLKSLSELSNLSISYLSELERKTGKRAGEDVVDRLADALNLTTIERRELTASFSRDGASKRRAMLFIDGRWLDTWGVRRLTQGRVEGTERREPFEFDFDALPRVIADALGGELEFTRRFFFSSEPVNLHPLDLQIAQPKT